MTWIRVFLVQNYPNPFTFSTTITYTIHKKSEVVLRIYNSKGKEVTTLIHEHQVPGTKSIVWYGTDDYKKKVSSGVYYCKLQNRNEVQSIKIIYQK